MPDSTKKTQTILFADIARSTRLYERLGDAHARLLIARCLEKLMQIAHAKRGRVIKTIGDEVMCTFDLPDNAVSAACSMHEEISSDATLSEYHMQLRIGLHYGPVIEEKSDVYGDAVNIAARMVEQAKGGQITTSDSTVRHLSKKHQSIARRVEHARIKGKFSPIHLYELSWGHPEELTMITTIGCHEEETAPKSTMHLFFSDSSIVMDQEHPVVALGRDTSNDIIFNDPRVSRLHARIELRKDKFVLVDQSTNGTYLQRQDGQIALVRWDEIALSDQGIIGLGEKPGVESVLIVRFSTT